MTSVRPHAGAPVASRVRSRVSGQVSGRVSGRVSVATAVNLLVPARLLAGIVPSPYRDGAQSNHGEIAGRGREDLTPLSGSAWVRRRDVTVVARSRWAAVAARDVIGVTRCSGSSSSSAPRRRPHPRTRRSTAWPSRSGSGSTTSTSPGGRPVGARTGSRSHSGPRPAPERGSSSGSRARRVVWNSGAVRGTANKCCPMRVRVGAERRLLVRRANRRRRRTVECLVTVRHLRDRPRQRLECRLDLAPGDTRTADPDQYTYAAQGGALDASPIVRARVYVSGDQQYELYVNGTRAGKGEAYSYPDTQYYETLDVTGLLRAGAANALGLLYSWDGPTKGHPGRQPGVIAQISVLHRRRPARDDRHRRLVAGTARARGCPGTQRDLEGDLVDYTENIDGPAEPGRLGPAGFDDSAGRPQPCSARPATAPWTPPRVGAHPHRRGARCGRCRYDARHRRGGRRLRQGLRGGAHGDASITAWRGGTITMHAGYLLDEPVAGQPAPAWRARSRWRTAPSTPT